MSEATAVKERGILFSGPMVRANLEWRKTQTRRLVKWANSSASGSRNKRLWASLDWASPDIYADSSFSDDGRPYYLHVPTKCADARHRVRCEIEAGMRLWVQETWAYEPDDERWAKDPSRLLYRATFDEAAWGEYHNDDERPHWRSSIHMPRWASRLTLEVVSVRVERVEDISEHDALAEGFRHTGPDSEYFIGAARQAFLHTFYDLNKRAPRGSNPWVWPITYKRVEESPR